MKGKISVVSNKIIVMMERSLIKNLKISQKIVIQYLHLFRIKLVYFNFVKTVHLNFIVIVQLSYHTEWNKIPSGHKTLLIHFINVITGILCETQTMFCISSSIYSSKFRAWWHIPSYNSSRRSGDAKVINLNILFWVLKTFVALEPYYIFNLFLFVIT